MARHFLPWRARKSSTADGDFGTIGARFARKSLRGRQIDKLALRAVVNGEVVEREVEPRLLLSDFLRHDLGLTGTHVGCEHGVCGACTVQLDGEPVRACLLFAIQIQGREVRTVEALSGASDDLHPLQQAFRETHALQCGFCTPGFLMSLEPFVEQHQGQPVGDEEIRDALSGNLCRCTGYQNIVQAVRLALDGESLTDQRGGDD